MGEYNDHKEHRSTLVERLDSDIGEASAGIGVMLSELIRRTLRGGVAKIEEEMDQYVEEKLEVSISEQMPRFEQTASKMAEGTARTVASSLITETEDRLSGQIDETRKQAETNVSTARQDLTQEIASTRQQVEEQTRSLLAGEIGSLKEKSYKTYENIQSALQQLSSTADSLKTELSAEQQQRTDELTQLAQTVSRQRDEDQQRAGELQHQVTTLLEQLSSAQSLIDQQKHSLVNLGNQHAALLARVSLLEQPKGLKALWAKMRGKNSSPAEDSASVGMLTAEGLEENHADIQD